jgi:hypothetical protein
MSNAQAGDLIHALLRETQAIPVIGTFLVIMSISERRKYLF